MDITQEIAQELTVPEWKIQAAINLLDEGATVPFIARYRKEATGALDDGQLRHLAERLQYLRELEDRKKVIIQSISEQDKLTPELEVLISVCTTKTVLEDLYLPYKPKRRTKAQIARENGLEALANLILEQQEALPDDLALDFITENVPDIKSALDGARAILLEKFSEDADLLGKLRNLIWQKGILNSLVYEGKEEEALKFKDYFAYQEALKKIPSHRALALFRGRQENLLQLSIKLEDDEIAYAENLITERFEIKNNNQFLQQSVRLAWRAKLFLSLELDAFQRLREDAEQEAIKVFAKNLHDLLLMPPSGAKRVLALDPGFRTGIKVAAIDETGKLLATDVVYLHHEQEALLRLSTIIKEHQIELLAIGNGTASRETEQLIRPLLNPKLKKSLVSEAGASVYSASELAAQEFPNLDVSYRGAISIARRLQDPLAELVKIEPKAIGVGQYQHDVNQSALARALDDVVEDCVNAVGVDLNTASAPLLARVSGLNQTLAKNIVQFREENGAFKNRQQLLKVPRLGAKTFEQSAAFLRISNGDNILDYSAVHPEAYGVVEKILQKVSCPAEELIGNSQIIKRLNAKDFTDERFGILTVNDILQELEKPNRDPRGEFISAEFAENVLEIKDLVVGMRLQGVVSNVANFGAFVDIGVHQDGLVHISMMADKFVENPHEIVKAGDIVSVEVLEVDVDRKRISLSMKKNNLKNSGKNETNNVKNIKNSKDTDSLTAMALAFKSIK